MPRKTKDQLEIVRLQKEIAAKNRRISELLEANNRFEQEAAICRQSVTQLRNQLQQERDRAAELPDKIRELLGDYPMRPREFAFWSPDAFRPPRGW